MAFAFLFIRWQTNTKTTQTVQNDWHNNTQKINCYPLFGEVTYLLFSRINTNRSKFSDPRFLLIRSLWFHYVGSDREDASIAAELGVPVLYLRKTSTQDGTREKIPIAFVFSMLALWPSNLLSLYWPEKISGHSPSVLFLTPVKQEKLIKSNCRHIFLTLKLNTIKGIKIVLDFQVEAIICKTKVK